MKKLFLLLALCLGASSVNAQISTGETSAKVIRTGNRAKAGNFGIYVGATSDIFKNIGDGDMEFSALPLINLKYMGTDQVEYRLGLEWWKKTESNEDEDNETSDSESSFMFYPGVAYHFSPRNLLDVYVGGELPVGFGSVGYEYGDNDESASVFKVGLGAFIGLQAYIANLPLAIGLEYGVSTLYHHVGDGMLDNGEVTIAEDNSYSQWKLGHQARLTLSYYFDL